MESIPPAGLEEAKLNFLMAQEGSWWDEEKLQALVSARDRSLILQLLLSIRN